MSTRKKQGLTYGFLLVALAAFGPLEILSWTAFAAENAVPLINQPLVPDATAPGGAGFTLAVHGTGFVSGAVVNWNHSSLATTLVSDSQLTASVPASDIAAANTASVTVVNPSPGGGASNVMFFEVTPSSSSIALSAPSTFGAGSNPNSVTVGDFNGDGKLDLVVANEGSGNVSILLGNGNGTFQAAMDYGAGTDPDSVAVGDFRGDGKLDLVVANGGSNNVSILLGNGDGTFQAAVNYGVGSGSAPMSVAAGDFNGDGKLDLAVANEFSNNVSILLGNGDGTFKTAVNYGAGSTLFAVAVGDFNGDGKLDLAVADAVSDYVSVLLGNGDGTFKTAVQYVAGLEPLSVAVADFNGDGKLDLAVANYEGNNVSILLGKGNGTFQAAVNYGTGTPGSVAVGDFNGDGKLDLVVVGGVNSDNVSVVALLLGNGDGTFQAAVNYGTGADTSVALGDFNGDGRLDLAFPASLQLQTPLASLSSTSLNFGNQLLGTTSAANAVTLSNPSGLALISSIAVTGTNAADFSQTNTCGSGLAVGASCTITVTFKPTQSGPRTASVTITDNAEGTPQTISLSGTGLVSGPNATLSAASLTFATQLVGTSSSAQSVTLTNYGKTALSITSIAASGDFSQTNTCGSSLAAEASCTIGVTFKPTQRATRTGTLSITDNVAGNPQTVSLTGTATVVEFNPASLGFGSVRADSKTTLTTTLSNRGSTALSISSITITGSTTFSQTNTCGTSVAAGGACTISGTFRPTRKGNSSGDVSVTDSGGGPQQVPLSGLVY